mmetsp:Transcript_24991/g.64486  ORF Transcript_24991/g.64486 Transcript_24991/m.64486 type:complete len:286 (+) Transcript_24991:31-888(+)
MPTLGAPSERSPRPEGDDAYRLRPIEPDANSASASDAGSTISTNPNSIFSNANTVRFGNVLSLEDFKGCPCPLDDIMEHEQHRDNRSASPKSVRADKTSRAESPVNHEDLDMDALEFEQSEPGVKNFAAMGVEDCADEDALLQAAVYASLNEMASNPSVGVRAAGGSRGGGNCGNGGISIGMGGGSGGTSSVGCGAGGGSSAGSLSSNGTCCAARGGLASGAAGTSTGPLASDAAARAYELPPCHTSLPTLSPSLSARARGKQPASAAALCAASARASSGSPMSQ